jgi:hypothetical protein
MSRAYDVAHLSFSFRALHTSACSTRCTFCHHTNFKPTSQKREKMSSTYFSTLLFSFMLKLRSSKSKCHRTVPHCTVLIRREVVSCLWFNETETKLENHHSLKIHHWLPSHLKCTLRKKWTCCFMPGWSCLICSLIHCTSLASFLNRLSNGSLNKGTWFYQIRLANWCCSQKTN